MISQAAEERDLYSAPMDDLDIVLCFFTFPGYKTIVKENTIASNKLSSLKDIIEHSEHCSDETSRGVLILSKTVDKAIEGLNKFANLVFVIFAGKSFGNGHINILI
ncbi:hypothetical protein Tco_0356823 [Tanacetum coccineum]